MSVPTRPGLREENQPAAKGHPYCTSSVTRWIHGISTKKASKHWNEKREETVERWISLLVRYIRFGMERVKALPSLAHEGISSKPDYSSKASFGLCLFHLLKYPLFSFFSEMEASAVVSLAIQTSVAGVKGRHGQKEQFAVHAGALLFV